MGDLDLDLDLEKVKADLEASEYSQFGPSSIDFWTTIRECERLRAELATLRQASEWNDDMAGAPRDGTTFEAYGSYSTGPMHVSLINRTQHIDGDEKARWVGFQLAEFYPTHWRPIQPPEVKP